MLIDEAWESKGKIREGKISEGKISEGKISEGLSKLKIR